MGRSPHQSLDARFRGHDDGESLTREQRVIGIAAAAIIVLLILLVVDAVGDFVIGNCSELRGPHNPLTPSSAGASPAGIEGRAQPPHRHAPRRRASRGLKGRSSLKL